MTYPDSLSTPARPRTTSHVAFGRSATIDDTMASFWMNVDRTSKTCILHRASCVHAYRRGEAGHKAINSMERRRRVVQFFNRVRGHHVFRRRRATIRHRASEAMRRLLLMWR